MSEKRKPILCLDFDGVIHDYREGWKDGCIYGSVTPGFFTWAVQAAKHFKLVIYSSRSRTPEGIAAMKQWMTRQLDVEFGDEIAWPIRVHDFEFAHEKPPAFLTIDDRAVTFKGDWSDWKPEYLLKFKTWSQI